LQQENIPIFRTTKSQQVTKNKYKEIQSMQAINEPFMARECEGWGSEFLRSQS
jgi:hypothetical protein